MNSEQAGTLDERVTIEIWRAARDAAADDVGSWQLLDQVFAAVRFDGVPGPATGGEAPRSGQRWQVWLRDRAELGLGVRLRWRGQILSVRALARDPRQRTLATLYCDGRPA